MMKRRLVALALSAGLALSAAACEDDVNGEDVEQEVEEGVDEGAEELTEDDG